MNRSMLPTGPAFETGGLPEHEVNKILNKAEESAYRIIQREREKLEQRIGELLRLSGKGAPAYVLAVFSVDAGRPTEQKQRPYQWLWETRYFGTMLYGYLRGGRGKKRLPMKDVCYQWLDRAGAPMPYRSIVTMHAAGQLPDRLEDSLARALEAAGYPYNPPALRDRRTHRGKIDLMLESRRKVNSR